MFVSTANTREIGTYIYYIYIFTQRKATVTNKVPAKNNPTCIKNIMISFFM